MVLRNIWRERQFWRQLGKFLRREGADPIVSVKFYCALIQTVPLFVSETWVMTAAIMQNLEEVHMVFMRQVIGKKYQRLGYETWRKEGADSVLQVMGKKSLGDYINKRQATVSEWVDLRPIFELCAN